MELLRKNFLKVADSEQYAGSMQAEYEARAATTANNMQLLQNRVTGLGISVGNVLLPPLNEFLGFVGPLVDGLANFANAHPAVIQGVLGAAAGLVALRVAMLGVSVAMGIINTVAGMSVVGIVVRLIAMAAGFLIANWSSVAPFFAKLWDGIKVGTAIFWDWIKTAFSFTPLGLIISNWEPIVAWFSRLWDRVKPYVQPLISGAQWVGQKVGAFFGGGNAPAAPQRAPGFQADPGVVRDWGGSLAGQTAQAQQLRGDMVVRFENAPPGTRVDPGNTNQPGLTMTPRVGYRSLSGAS
jgi:hypothetical protein